MRVVDVGADSFRELGELTAVVKGDRFEVIRTVVIEDRLKSL